MTVQEIRAVRADEIAEYGWEGLARYKNEKFTSDLICSIHNISKKDRSNVKKTGLADKAMLDSGGRIF